MHGTLMVKVKTEQKGNLDFIHQIFQWKIFNGKLFQNLKR